jgi:hypothetical protein
MEDREKMVKGIYDCTFFINVLTEKPSEGAPRRPGNLFEGPPPKEVITAALRRGYIGGPRIR